jgi:hypothetical protein
MSCPAGASPGLETSSPEKRQFLSQSPECITGCGFQEADRPEYQGFGYLLQAFRDLKFGSTICVFYFPIETPSTNSAPARDCNVTGGIADFPCDGSEIGF